VEIARHRKAERVTVAQLVGSAHRIAALTDVPPDYPTSVLRAISTDVHLLSHAAANTPDQWPGPRMRELLLAAGADQAQIDAIETERATPRRTNLG
jgi:hypothetical protein